MPRFKTLRELRNYYLEYGEANQERAIEAITEYREYKASKRKALTK